MIWSLHFLRGSFYVFSPGNETPSSIFQYLFKSKTIRSLDKPDGLPGFPEVSLMPRGHCVKRVRMSLLSALKFPNAVWVIPSRWHSSAAFWKRQTLSFSKSITKRFYLSSEPLGRLELCNRNILLISWFITHSCRSQNLKGRRQSCFPEVSSTTWVGNEIRGFFIPLFSTYGVRTGSPPLSSEHTAPEFAFGGPLFRTQSPLLEDCFWKWWWGAYTCFSTLHVPQIQCQHYLNKSWHCVRHCFYGKWILNFSPHEGPTGDKTTAGSSSSLICYCDLGKGTFSSSYALLFLNEQLLPQGKP